MISVNKKALHYLQFLCCYEIIVIKKPFLGFQEISKLNSKSEKNLDIKANDNSKFFECMLSCS